MSANLLKTELEAVLGENRSLLAEVDDLIWNGTRPSPSWGLVGTLRITKDALKHVAHHLKEAGFLPMPAPEMATNEDINDLLQEVAKEVQP